MGAGKLGSRAIIGRFFERLEQNVGSGWVPAVSMGPFQSDQEVEKYPWLGAAPAMREWVGARMARGLRDNDLSITNKKYEGTLEVLVDEIRRDKTDQVMIRVDELADRTNAHWAKLLSQQIIDGESKTCYDGQYFFDTDHAEADSGTQNNDITYNVGTPTAPTAAEMELAVMSAVEQILGFKDDVGEPMNENAREFLVMVPVTFFKSAAAALKNPVIVDGSGSRTNLVPNLDGFRFALEVNQRLTWTDKFAVFRQDGQTKALIRQSEEAVTVAAIAEGSELEFREDKHHYGVKAIRNVGFGRWQHACLVTLT